MCLEVALCELEKRVLHSRIPDGFLYRRMKATIIRRLAITITRMVALGRAPDLARLMCHSEDTQQEIYNAELFQTKVA